MADDSNSQPESVHGLDPRALFARVLGSQKPSSSGGVWNPPSPKALQAELPQFEIAEIIGRGGMGAVYRARQPALDRLVAIKVLPAEVAEDDSFAIRFQSEARTLAQLQHPHVVTIHDFGQTDAGLWYFVMEYVSGGDLGALIKKGPVPSARVVEIGGQITSALEFAHRHQVIHRDIKPANVLLTTEGHVKVADFGLAALASHAGNSDFRLTATGAVVGTPDYLAPEQRMGDPVDARADLYSFGVLLYELLTGHLPLGTWEPPSRLVDSDPRLDGIIRRALRGDPDLRYGDAARMRADLAQIAHPDWRRWFAYAGVICVVVSIASVVAWSGLGAYPSGQPTPTPVPERTPEPESFLAGLDLDAAILAGEWHWVENRPGDALMLPRAQTDGAKRVRLPIRPGAGPYNLTFQIRLDDEVTDAGVILQVGRARVGLIMNRNNASGLGLVQGRTWERNDSSTGLILPIRRWCTVDVAVRPNADRAAVVVRVNDRVAMRWNGPQSELTLWEPPPNGWSVGDQESLGFASNAGGLQVRQVQFRRGAPNVP